MHQTQTHASNIQIAAQLLAKPFRSSDDKQIVDVQPILAQPLKSLRRPTITAKTEPSSEHGKSATA